MVNIARNWGAINILSPTQYEISDEFPFSFKPDEKVSTQDLMEVLQNHYEGTELEDKEISTPHDYDIIPICRKDTQYGLVAQLRNWLPHKIGNVMWIAPHRPCSQVFIPWYFGISEIPINFNIGHYKSALENHFAKYDDIRTQLNMHNFWDYVKYTEQVDTKYYELMSPVTVKKEITQKQIFDEFSEFDDKISEIYCEDIGALSDSINTFTNEMIDVSIKYLENK